MDKEKTRQRIINEAIKLFSKLGYARTTTRKIAAGAGITEITLFRHFGSKENLFTSIIERFAAPLIIKSFVRKIRGDIRQDMIMFGTMLFDTIYERKEALLTMINESRHFPKLNTILRQNPRKLRTYLASYLNDQMDRGKIKRMHAEIAAQAFIGMIFGYAISLGIFTEEVSPPVTKEEIIESYVELFLCGVKL
ncbi:MAG: TetR/AcrR family transcriptional regulator [Spirochaetales bacterium]|nr:TetR/AcrR family transcriptional regulator [Spirochaetales bacterium]